jgi:cyclic pyranopterin phosphate synthase
MPNKLSHLNAHNEVEMVDVSKKSATLRQAIASGQIIMSRASLQQVEQGNSPKGDVIATAKIAGIMAAKQTSSLIPLCHPLPLSQIGIQIKADEQLPGYYIEASVKTKAETGVEMEALTAVSVTALTLYDMIKAIDKSMIITQIKLISKTGGKSDYHRS